MGRGRVLGRWVVGAGFAAAFCPDLPGFSDIWWRRARCGARRRLAPSAGAWSGGWVGWLAEVAGFVLRGASFLNSKNFKKVRGASRSDYVIPASRPSRKLQAVPGEGFSRAVLPRGDPARRWCTTALVALRGGCPLSRAVRRPAFAAHSPLFEEIMDRGGELSVLARKRSGDRGDLSFPVVTGIG